MSHPETIKQLNMICLGFAMLIIGLGIALYALQRLGPEPEIGAADYKQWLCADSPGLPECRQNDYLAQSASDHLQAFHQYSVKARETEAMLAELGGVR